MSLPPSRRALFAALVAALPAFPALAANDPLLRDDDEQPFFEELPTVLSASRLPQALNEAPGAVTILDRDFIRATGYRDLARLLRLVPGMQIGQERGHAQWVTYHGLGSDYPTEIQVLIDGRSVYAPSSFGGVDWSALPLTIPEIERIEVVRGTNSNAYGANAFLGVINIITRHSQQDHGASAQANAGSHGIADLQASWTGGSDDGPAVRVSVAEKRDNGFSRLFDDQRSHTFSLRSDYRLDARDELTLRAGYNHLTRGMGYPDSVFGNNAERTGGTEASTLHLTWRRTLGEDEEWLVSAYRNHENSIDRWTAGAPTFGFPAVPLDRNRTADRTNVELQHRFAISQSARMVWGLETRRDETSSPFLFAGGRPPALELYRAFSNLDWRLTPEWQLNLGGLLEKNGAVAPQFIPRAFVNWHPTPRDTFRAGYARAWQQRNLFDLYGDIRAYDPASRTFLAWPYQPNPDLRVPRVDTVELGYLGRFQTFDATLDVRIFSERVTDFVVRRLVPADGAILPLPSSRFENLGSPIELRGIEFQYRARPRPGTELLASHSLVERRTDDREVAKRTAPYTASLTWLQQYDNNWSSALSVLRMGPLAGGYGYVPGCDYTARPYTTADLRVARSFQLDGRHAEIALNGINLGNRHQEIADRSEQCLPSHLGSPVNPVSPMGWVSFSIEL